MATSHRCMHAVCELRISGGYRSRWFAASRGFADHIDASNLEFLFAVRQQRHNDDLPLVVSEPHACRRHSIHAYHVRKKMSTNTNLLYCEASDVAAAQRSIAVFVLHSAIVVWHVGTVNFYVVINSSAWTYASLGDLGLAFRQCRVVRFNVARVYEAFQAACLTRLMICRPSGTIAVVLMAVRSQRCRLTRIKCIYKLLRHFTWPVRQHRTCHVASHAVQATNIDKQWFRRSWTVDRFIAEHFKKLCSTFSHIFLLSIKKQPNSVHNEYSKRKSQAVVLNTSPT